MTNYNLLIAHDEVVFMIEVFLHPTSFQPTTLEDFTQPTFKVELYSMDIIWFQYFKRVQRASWKINRGEGSGVLFITDFSYGGCEGIRVSSFTLLPVKRICTCKMVAVCDRKHYVSDCFLRLTRHASLQDQNSAYTKRV